MKHIVLWVLTACKARDTAGIMIIVSHCKLMSKARCIGMKWPMDHVADGH